MGRSLRVPTMVQNYIIIFETRKIPGQHFFSCPGICLRIVVIAQFFTKQNRQVISPAIENPVYHDFLIVNVIKRHIAPADQLAIGNRTAGNQNRRSGFRKLLQSVQLGGDPLQSLSGCTGIGED